MKMSVQVHAPHALPREECVPDIQSRSENFGEEKLLTLAGNRTRILGFSNSQPNRQEV